MKYELNTFEKAGKLVDFCRKFEEDIDVKHNRYTVDAKSILGVTGLIGNEVEINILTSNKKLRSDFEDDLRKL